MVRFYTLLFVTLSIVLIPQAGFAETVRSTAIGSVSWYTQDNSFKAMQSIASVQQKNIMAVFSAAWCMPCQLYKKQVFSEPAFASVADKVVLWYIEETTKPGRKLVEAFKIKAFPTFVMFSPTGVRLDDGDVGLSVEDFATWIVDVAEGRSLHQLRQRLIAHSDDREAMLHLSARVETPAEQIQLLLAVVRGHEEADDDISSQARERLLATLVETLDTLPEESLSSFQNDYQQLFEQLMGHGFPEAFRYELKGAYAREILMLWNNAAAKVQQNEELFKEWLMAGRSVPEGVGLFRAMVRTYVDHDNVEKTMDVVRALDSFVTLVPDLMLNDAFLRAYLDTLLSAAYLTSTTVRLDELKQIESIYDTRLRFLMESVDSPINRESIGQYIVFLSQHFAMLNDLALSILDVKIREEKGLLKLSAFTDKVAIVNQTVTSDQFRQFMVGAANDPSLRESLNPYEQAQFFNNIAWSLYEDDFYDDDVLAIARKSVELSMEANNLDTLACILAARGDYDEAIGLEKRALKKVKASEEPGMAEALKQNIVLWQELRKQ